MYIQSLSLTNFKNYPESQFEFSEQINCLVGNNGVGKTNILDAIHYLSLTKSFFNNSDSSNILHGEDFFIISGRFCIDNETINATCSFQRNKQKVFKCNSKEYSRLSDHIGKFPVVMISPSDHTLILGGSEVRRKFANKIISQFDAQYLEAAINYDKALKQRNNILKNSTSQRRVEEELLQIWDMQLVRYGTLVFEKRTQLIKQLEPSFQQFYSIISDNKESVSLSYRSHLSDGNFSELLQKQRDIDIAAQYTTIGVHKDDIIFEMSGYPIKNMGSQGQQKSYLTALKLAKYNYIENRSGVKPILLLDDIFDKFDTERVGRILQIVTSNNFGQIFITDTQHERLQNLLDKYVPDYKILSIK